MAARPPLPRSPWLEDWLGSIHRPATPGQAGPSDLSIPLKAQSLLQTCPGSLTKTAMSSARRSVLPGRITRSVLSPNKQNKEPSAPCVGLGPPGGCSGSVLRGGGQPAAHRTLSTCRLRVNISEPRAGRGTHGLGSAPLSRLKVCQPEGAESPFHSSSRPPHSAPKPTCLPGSLAGPDHPDQSHSDHAPPRPGSLQTPCLLPPGLGSRCCLHPERPFSQSLSSQLPQQGVRPASPWLSGVAETARVRVALQTLSESIKERLPQVASLLPAGESPVGRAELSSPRGRLEP